MELFTDLGLGFATALSPFNLLYCFIGVLLGTLVGVLPGHRRRPPPSPCCCRSPSGCRR